MPSRYQPEKQYIPQPGQVKLIDLYRYADEYVMRPPYQRKTVWKKQQQQQLIDSIFKGYYIPDLVLRYIKVKDHQVMREVIDGQQRITAVQKFMKNEFAMPEGSKFEGLFYKNLSTEVKRFIDDSHLSATLIEGIDDINNLDHHKIATDIFWRLQQGESLNYMEVANASITSRVRNFLVKYGDDGSFDYDAYESKDENPDKHKFFKIIRQKNDRMQHLSLLGRLLLIENAGGYTDIKDTSLGDLIEKEKVDETGNFTYEKQKSAKAVLYLLNKLSEIAKKDPFVIGGGKLAWPEYLIISFYLIVRHIDNFYVWNDELVKLLSDFFIKFLDRWRKREQNDTDIHAFRNDQQQAESDLRNRDLILRQLFFDFVREQGAEILRKDEKRHFNEAERIAIYRSGNGKCVQCIEDGKSDEECEVPWSEYEADHIIAWSKGGASDPDENAQILCRTHNRQKGAR